MSLLKKDKEYAAFLYKLKSRIKSAQIKAAVSVNRDLMELYWELAEKIVEKQPMGRWPFNANEQRLAGRIPGYEGVFPSKSEIYTSMVSVLD